MSEIKTVKDVLDEVFQNKHLEDFVTKEPYLSFVILCPMIELMGKIKRNPSQFQDLFKGGSSKQDFEGAINGFAALSSYKQFVKSSSKNDLYSAIRCGLLHAFLPQGNIKLSDGNNDVNNMVIGAKNLYKDLKEA